MQKTSAFENMRRQHRIGRAGHDAGFMSRICRSAMVFVPCKAGKSHAPEEWRGSREQIAAGAAVILQAIKALDKTLR